MQIWKKTILNPATRHDWRAQTELSGQARNVADSSQFRLSYHGGVSFSRSLDLLFHRTFAGRLIKRRFGTKPTANGIPAIIPSSLSCGERNRNSQTRRDPKVTCYLIAERDSAETIHSNSRCSQSAQLDGRPGRQFPMADRQRMNSINQTISRIPNSLLKRDRGKQKTNQNEKRNANQRVAIRRDSNCDCGKQPVGGALR